MNNMKHLERSTIVTKAILVVVLTTVAISGLKSQVNYYQTYLQHELNTVIGNRYVRADVHGDLPLPD